MDSLDVYKRQVLDNSEELKKLENIYKKLKAETTLSLCASHGICSKEVLAKAIYCSLLYPLFIIFNTLVDPDCNGRCKDLAIFS